MARVPTSKDELAALGGDVLRRVARARPGDVELRPASPPPLGVAIPLSRLAEPLGLRARRIRSSGESRDTSPAEEAGLLAMLDRVPAGGFGATPAPPLVFVRVRRRVAPPPPPPEREEKPSELGGLRALLGGLSGQLPPEQRAALEPVPGVKTDDERAHTGPTAAATAAAVGAAAFTVGRDVFFGAGQFDPQSPRGKALLAHELVHVHQQEAGARLGDTRSDEAEREAETVERSVFAAAQPPGGEGLRVDRFARAYRASDGGPLLGSESSRLDVISSRALAVCEGLLGPETLSRPRDLGSVRAVVTLDLRRLTDEEAAQVWGRPLALAIQRAASD